MRARKHKLHRRAGRKARMYFDFNASADYTFLLLSLGSFIA